MSKLTKYAMQVFGINAGPDQIGVFGSLAEGSPAFTTNPTTIQSLAPYLEGWFAAVVEGNSPAIEDMNAIHYLYGYQLSYIMQSGVPEWDADTVYYSGSIANSSGVLYSSITDGNVGNSVTNPSFWEQVSGATGIVSINGNENSAQTILGTTNTSVSSVSGATTIDVSSSLLAAIASKLSGLTVNAPLTSTGGTTPIINLPQATGSQSGYLSYADWESFNSRGFGTVTSVGLTSSDTSILTVSGTSPITGSGSFALEFATQNPNLVLAGPASGISVGIPTFRNLVALDIPALPYAPEQLLSGHIFIGSAGNVATDTVLSGDATVSNTGVLTLATVNSSPNSFGGVSQTLEAVVNGKGLLTALTAVAIQITESQVTNLVSDLAGKQPTGNYLTALTGDATASGPGNATLTLATVNPDPGTYAWPSVVQTNAKGLITAILNVPVATGQFLAGPATGSSANVSPRAIVASDIPALSYVSSVTGTAPVVSSGGLTPALSMAAATASVNGYLTSFNFNVFNGAATNVSNATSANTPSTLVARNTAGDAVINNLNASNFFAWGSSTVLFPATGAYRQVMTGGGPNDQNLNLPNATTLPLGYQRLFINNGNNFNDLDIYAFDGTTLQITVGPFSSAELTLLDNTTSNGVWNTASFIPTGASWSGGVGINLGNGSLLTGNAGGVGSTSAIEFTERFIIYNNVDNAVLIVGQGDDTQWSINDNASNAAIEVDDRLLFDSSGNIGLSWDVGFKQLVSDSSVIAFDWNEMQFFSPATGNLIAAMGYNTEFDTAVVHLSSIDFGSGLCTVTSSTGAGTGGSATLSANSNDLNGQVNLTTGTLPSASAKIFTITLGHNYGAPPQSVQLHPLNSATALATTSVYYSFATSTSTTVDVYSTTSALLPSTAYKWSYIIVE